MTGKTWLKIGGAGLIVLIIYLSWSRISMLLNIIKD
jgi:hypothetical protein